MTKSALRKLRKRLKKGDFNTIVTKTGFSYSYVSKVLYGYDKKYNQAILETAITIANENENAKNKLNAQMIKP